MNARAKKVKWQTKKVGLFYGNENSKPWRFIWAEGRNRLHGGIVVFEHHNFGSWVPWGYASRQEIDIALRHGVQFFPHDWHTGETGKHWVKHELLRRVQVALDEYLTAGGVMRHGSIYVNAKTDAQVGL